MAYNACLARHGPKANEIGTHPGQPRDRGARFRLGGAQGASQAGAGGQREPHVTRAHGRMHMEFTVK